MVTFRLLLLLSWLLLLSSEWIENGTHALGSVSKESWQLRLKLTSLPGLLNNLKHFEPSDVQSFAQPQIPSKFASKSTKIPLRSFLLIRIIANHSLAFPWTLNDLRSLTPLLFSNSANGLSRLSFYLSPPGFLFLCLAHKYQFPSRTQSIRIWTC